jgi:hypothetical protein
MSQVATIAHRGWPNCYRLWNDSVELVVTTDVGPRIIRFGFIGENEFGEFPEHSGQSGGDEFRLYGGHRLWHAPESLERTYCPDNAPVALERQADGVRITQPTEAKTGIQKEIVISLSPTDAQVQVVHRLWNRSLWAVDLAAWALTVMAPGGTAVIPLPPRVPYPQGLLPTGRLVLWPYTDPTDPRWCWGRKYILLRQDATRPSPQKLGGSVPDGWIAHVRNERLFVKTFRYAAGANYPDLGSTVETFADGRMLELETLSPIAHLEPGASVEHIETWHLWRAVMAPQDDNDVDRDVLPKVTALRGRPQRHGDPAGSHP